MYNELCHNESLVEAENVGNDLANWLINNKIIECIFGPNLHVEVSIFFFFLFLTSYVICVCWNIIKLLISVNWITNYLDQYWEIKNCI